MIDGMLVGDSVGVTIGDCVGFIVGFVVNGELVGIVVGICVFISGDNVGAGNCAVVISNVSTELIAKLASVVPPKTYMTPFT
mmetsp:Transcript_107721/g.131440  ORF Transcript_107721/g.131440 Transcript_107721/m.131440 type:complete len:82 (-) Transcript_107721:372-617(-)